MPTSAYDLDISKQPSTRGRTSNVPTQVDAVVVGTDSPALLFGLEAVVDAAPGLRLIGSVSSLHDFVDTCSRASRCIALIDPVLAGGSVIRILEGLAGRVEQVRLVLITAGSQPVWIREALKLGVLGFVKPSDPVEHIRSALQSAAVGQRHIPSDIASQLVESLTHEDLTQREMQVLDLLSRGQCNKVIARHLELTLGTVKTHVSAIMCKLGSPSRMTVILEANRRGLIRIG